MTKYYALPLATKYWKPGDNYLDIILEALEKKVADGDFVVISEKALSTALGRIIDERGVNPGFGAKVIARLWMRVVWGRFLSVLCRFGPNLSRRLREYPFEAGSRHKQVVLRQAGLLQALMRLRNQPGLSTIASISGSTQLQSASAKAGVSCR